MNKIAVVCASALLVGCSMLGAKFDNNEYAAFARIEAVARTAYPECHRPKIVRDLLVDLRTESEYLYTYSRYLPRNEDTTEISDTIRNSGLVFAPPRQDSYRLSVVR